MNVYRIDSRLSRDPCKYRGIKVSRAAVRVFSLRGARFAYNGSKRSVLEFHAAPHSCSFNGDRERKETVSAMNTNRTERIRAPLRASYRPSIVLRDMRLTSNLLSLRLRSRRRKFDGEEQVLPFVFEIS